MAEFGESVLDSEALSVAEKVTTRTWIRTHKLRGPSLVPPPSLICFVLLGMCQSSHFQLGMCLNYVLSVMKLSGILCLQLMLMSHNSRLTGH